MNPLPYSNARSPPEFAPPCDETVNRTASDTGRCSGRDPFDVLILDLLQVRATSGCHLAAQTNRFIPGFLYYSVAVFLK